MGINKKLLTTFSLTVFLAIGASALTSCGTSDAPYLYVENGDGTITFTGFSETNTAVESYSEFTVPSEIDGKKVTAIGNSALTALKNVVNVYIPEGVTSIGTSAFYNCSKLVSVDIPNSVTVIGATLFNGCTSLEYNVKNDIKYVGNSTNNYLIALDYVEVTETMVFEDGCQIIGPSIFNWETALKNISIPSTVKTISSSAFLGTAIENFDIPNSVTRIESSAFEYNMNITSYNIPNSVTYIGDNAFAFNYNLSEITIPNSVNYIGASVFYKNESLSSVNFEANVTSIRQNMFMGCKALEEFTVPNGITKIEPQAFAECTKLKTVNLPEGLLEIQGYAFSTCSTLVNINFPSTLVKVGNYAFDSCKKITAANLDSIKVIGDSAFSNCTNLVDLTISNDIESIGKGAFKKCDKLNFNVDGDFNYIGNNTNPYLVLFSTNEHTSEEVILAEGCKFILAEAVDSDTITKVTLPASIKVIYKDAFTDASKLTEVLFNGSVEELKSVTIEDDAFKSSITVIKCNNGEFKL